MHLPSLDMLQGFCAAAQTLNFRHAARLVSVTPAALGHRIRGLEALCGAQLFRRTTRSVELTDAGRRLVPLARETLAAAGECLKVAHRIALPMPTEVVVGTRPDLGQSWLVPQIDALAAHLPWLTLHLYIGSGEDLLARLHTREIDCAITSSRFADPRLDAIPLHREDLVFVAAPALLQRAPFTRPEHAAHHTLIDAGPDLPLFRYWRDAPGGGELPFGRILRHGSLAAIHHFVVAGRGVAVLPRYFVRTSLARRRLRPLFPRVRPLHDYFRLVYRVEDSRLDAYRALAQWLVRQPLA
ncbi:MAG: LysR family transcriptional regulator [Kofleriaceae bacterium]